MTAQMRDFPFEVEYRSGRDNLVADFYHPALGRCTKYWRAAGFFSSSAFEAIGAPLGEFVARGGTMRLVTSVRLEDTDVIAIEQGLDRQAISEARLLEQIRQEFTAPIGRGASLLAALLEGGHLEIAIAMPQHGRGIYHEKVGLFIEDIGDYVAFSGSSNESRSGLESNYECVDVFPSWTDSVRAGAKRTHFECLWNNTAAGVSTFPFPEALRRELIVRTRHSGILHRDRPTPPMSKWRHQDEAVQVFTEQHRGVLEMATGTGKTKTAMRICDILAGCGAIGTIIVSADGNDLLDQWHKILLQLTSQLPGRYSVHQFYEHHRGRDAFLLHSKNSILLCSRPNLASALSRLSTADAARTLLIHDEAHRLGSPANRTALKGLSNAVPYRLGLSATPDREYDEEGNRFIEEHIGPVIFDFGLDAAIRRGILSPFDYHPLDYVPDDEDRAGLHQVYRQVAARRNAGNPMSKEEMWTALARVYKVSKAKLPVFSAFIDRNQHLLKRSIIFVEDKAYGERVLDIVHRYRHDFHTYYGEDDKATLEQFAAGDIQCLITCHRLSEGIDIRSIGSVILFASARARLETIQRIGRCLRADPEDLGKRANVVDFVRLSPDTDHSNPDEERSAWLTALSQLGPEAEA